MGWGTLPAATHKTQGSCPAGRSLSWRGSARSWLVVFTLVLVLGFSGALLTARSATAADFTWTGGAPAGELNWSNATNWGGTAPAAPVAPPSYKLSNGTMSRVMTAPGTIYSTGSSAVQLKLADVNGDGWPDIVTANTTSDNLSTLKNLVNPGGLTAGTFSQPAILSSTGSGVTASDVAVGKFDNGKVGAVVVSNTSTVTVMSSDGNGTFTPTTTYALSGGQTANLVRLADFNGDGKLDIVVAGSVGYCEFGVNNSSAVAVLMGNGDGTFQTPIQFATGDCGGGFNNRSSADSGLAVADLNGDGRPDIVIASDSTDTGCDCGRVYVALNNGGGSFGMSLAANVPGMYGSSISTSLAVGNIGGRGISDIAVVSAPICGGTCARGVTVLLGNGDGTYAAPVFIQDPNLTNATNDTGEPTGIALADMNGDGLPDIVTSDIGLCCGGSNGFSVYLNRGDGLNGGLYAPVEIPTPNFAPTGLALADVNGDRKTDVVLNGGGSVDVLLNTSTEPDGGALTLHELLSGGHNPSEFCVVCFIGKLISFFLPVDAPTGNFWHTFNDLNVPGRGIPLNLTRTYNSMSASMSAATDGPFGFGWSFPYDMSLTFPDSTHVVVNQENGSQVIFTEQSGATYTAPPRVTATLVHNGDGSWTFVRRHKDTFSFNSSGRLTQEQDLNGYVTALAYDGSDQLTTVTDPAGRKLTFAYSGNHVSSVTDPLGRVVTYAYDGEGNLTDVTDVNGGDTHFTYDSAHRMLSMRFPNQAPGVPGSTGAVVSNKYDSQGRVIEQTDQLGRTTKFSYTGEPLSEAGGSTTITDPKGNMTVQSYQYGELLSETKGYGTPQAATWSFAYDPRTLGMTTVTDPNGHTTTSTFDSEGNTLTTTDALGRTTTNTYDSLNDPLTTTDPLGVTTTMTYDAHGNLLSHLRPLSGTSEVQTTTYTYGDSSHPGDVTAMTDPEGNAWKYTYDASGDRTSTTDPIGDKTTSTYNAIGWLLTTVSPRGNASGANPASFTTTYAHNNFGQVTETVDPLGHKTTSQYDPDQNLIASTDANGNTTTYTYDAADEQTVVHRADGTTRQTTYWPDGSVKEQIDGAGHATRYEYDPLARVSAVIDPLGRTTRYGYDLEGNRIAVTDPEGRITTTTYDAANEPTSITYSDGKTPNVTGITYDADGQRIGEADGSGTWSWMWDSLHRLTSVTEGNNGTVKYQYDLRSNPTTITYPDGHSVRRGYDAADRWTSVTDWLGNTTTFAYDSDGNPTSETLPEATGITDTSTYANDDTLSSISDTHGASTLFAANYTRDANRQLTSDSSQPASEGGYGYTALNQLCYAGSSTTSCASPPSGATGYQYDSADNLTKLGTTTQTFDAADELTSTSTPSGSSGEEEYKGNKQESAAPEPPVVHNEPTPPKIKIHGSHEERVLPTVTSGKIRFAHAREHGRVISQIVSTSGANDLLLAFVSAKEPRRGGQNVAGIKAGHLKWSAVTSGSFSSGYVSIWQARAPHPLKHTLVSVNMRKAGIPAVLDIVSFDSRSAVVNRAQANGNSGAAHVSTVVPANAAVWAVGQDALGHAKLKPLTGQTIVTKINAPGGAISWLQSGAPTSPGRLVLGESAPKSSSWVLAAVIVQERPGTTAKVARRTALTLSSLAAGESGATSLLGSGPRPAAAHPLTSSAAETTTFSYDTEGDRTGFTASNGASQTYSYNQALELTGVGNEVLYTYSGDGLRMSKTVGATTTPFTWDVASGLPSVLEDGTNGYVYGPGGLPLEQISGSSALWFHHDQLGGTRLLTNATGQTVATYSYTPYGGVSSSSGTVSTPLLYAGQYRDGESGLYYLRARYYDPTTAQFLTVDPAVANTMSAYGYSQGNPLNMSDPRGLGPCDAAAGDLVATACKQVFACTNLTDCTNAEWTVLNNLEIVNTDEQIFAGDWRTSCDAQNYRFQADQLNQLSTDVQQRLDVIQGNENLGHRLASGWNTAGDLSFGPGVAGTPGTPGLGANLGTGVAGVGVAFFKVAAAPAYLLGTAGGFLGGFIFGFAHNAEYAPPWH